MDKLVGRDSLRSADAELVQALQAENALLRKQLAKKDSFISGVSHELRTPLNVILGLTESLQEQIHGGLNANQLRLLGCVEESGHTLLTLINDVVDVASAGTGDLALSIEPVSAESLITSATRIVQQKAHKMSVEIMSKIGSGVQVFKADQRRIKQMLVYMLENALDTSPSGGKMGVEIIGDAQTETLAFNVWRVPAGDPDRANSSVKQTLATTYIEQIAALHEGQFTDQPLGGTGKVWTITIPWHNLSDSVASHELAEPLQSPTVTSSLKSA